MSLSMMVSRLRADRPRRRGIRPRLERVEDRCLLATFVVDNTSDSLDPGSLRWAIDQVNKDTDVSSQDLIRFQIPESDPGFNATTRTWTIAPATELIEIDRPVFIDGYSQPGA